MNFSDRFSRRHLLSSLFAYGVTAILPAVYAEDDPPTNPAVLQSVVDGITLTLRLPAAGVSAGTDFVWYLRLSHEENGEDTSVPFNAIDAVASLDGATVGPTEDTKPIALAAFPGGVSGEYALTGILPTAGNYTVTVTATPPNKDAQPLKATFTVTVRPGGEKNKEAESPFSLKVEAIPAQPLPGELVELRLSIVDSRTKKRVVEFEPIYDAPLHLYVLREDIGDMKHLKPERINAAPGSKDDGIFLLKYTFPAGGNWRMFVEVAPKNEGAQLLTAKIGLPGAKSLPEPLIAQLAPVVRMSGLTMRPERPIRLVAHQNLSLPYRLDDGQGQPVDDLQFVDGALAHLYFVERDGKTFLHLLPDTRDPRVGRSGTGIVAFPVRFPKGGTYRAWMVVNHLGQTLTLSFVVRVADK